MVGIAAPPRAAPAVELSSIRVQFGDVLANDDVSLAVERGEVHALLGENGAGKTTLIRVLAGLIRPSAGEIFIDRRPVTIQNPQRARALGIGVVHQHFMLVPTLSVVENVCLGLPELRRWFPTFGDAARRLKALSAQHGLEVDPFEVASKLSVAGQQRVEILKALYRGARILVLDEPTAVLSPSEIAGLIAVLRSLAAEGTSIIFISHKLREVMDVAQQVTVLRRGRVVASIPIAGASERELARMMVGGEVVMPQLAAPVGPARPAVLEVTGLNCRNADGRFRVEDATFTVGGGEIVGIAGVDGNGQRELVEAIVGLRPAASGTVIINGRDCTSAPVAGRMRAGLAHIPEDRHRTAIFEPMPIADNIMVEVVGEPALSRYGFVRQTRRKDLARRVVEDFDIRSASLEQPVGQLSGGNQQKLVLGRALHRAPSLIIAVQPTRGLDIGATAFLHRQLLERRKGGSAVLLVSMELDEILTLADRILVMFRGMIVGTVTRDHASTERLGLMMAGQAA